MQEQQAVQHTAMAANRLAIAAARKKETGQSRPKREATASAGNPQADSFPLLFVS